MEFFLEVLKVILESFGSILIVIIAAFVIYGLKLVCKRLGIEINDTDYEKIITIIKQVIKYLDQKYVDTIKKDSTDGKLTEHQQATIKTKALELIKSALTLDHVQYLLSKYNLDDIDDVLDLLIESSIADARKDSSTGGIIINEESLSEIGNDKPKPSTTIILNNYERRSIDICKGNCKVCGLHCKYCRCTKCQESLNLHFIPEQDI